MNLIYFGFLAEDCNDELASEIDALRLLFEIVEFGMAVLALGLLGGGTTSSTLP